MNHFSYSGRAIWLEHDELRPVFDYLKDNVDLLGGSELFDNMLDAYEDSSDAITGLKEELSEKIDELTEELEG